MKKILEKATVANLAILILSGLLIFRVATLAYEQAEGLIIFFQSLQYSYRLLRETLGLAVQVLSKVAKIMILLVMIAALVSLICSQFRKSSSGAAKI